LDEERGVIARNCATAKNRGGMSTRANGTGGSGFGWEWGGSRASSKRTGVGQARKK